MLMEEFNWKNEVLESAEPVLVDFWSPRCQPCLRMNPVLKALAADYKICKVNVDNNPELANHYNISGIPALKIFKGGKVAKEFLGWTAEEDLRGALEQLSS